MFIDHSKIYVKAGDGGNGALSFHTEKYITNGGPDGGDGGDGGDVILQAARNLTSLQNFRFKHKFIGNNGAKGMGKKMYGKRGEDLIIGVPVGTVVKDLETGEIIADLTEEGQKVVVAKGGKGGLGNMHYANSVRQAPQFATPGTAGEERELSIEVTDEVKDFLAKDGYSEAYGARPLRRAVQSMIEDTIAEAILDGKVKDKAVVTEKDGVIEVNGK